MAVLQGCYTSDNGRYVYTYIFPKSDLIPQFPLLGAN